MSIPATTSGILTPARFSAAYRLLRENGFSLVLKADNISDKHFKIFFVRNNKGHARLGIIASKKILPRAVDRNRFKRVVRAEFRVHHIKSQQLDMVVMIRPACAQSGTKNLDLKPLLGRVEARLTTDKQGGNQVETKYQE